jgi:hypothetical protein
LSDSERLLVIDITNSEGRIILRSVWAVTSDIRSGRRRTDIEAIADPAVMLHRLRELVAKLYEPTLAAAA